VIPHIRFHDPRHCHATLLLQQSVHPKIVQERLGHVTPAFTLHVYSHVLPEMQHEAAKRLQKRLFGDPNEPNESTGR
jgi:integrase